MANGKPKGVSLHWTMEDIARVSVVEPQDAAAAVRAWQAVAPAKYRELIMAGLSGSRATFDAERMLYQVGGATVPQRSVKQAVNSAIDVWSKQLSVTSAQMVNGDITIGEWQTLMAEKIKSMHTAVSVVGRGGVGQITHEDALFIEGDMRFQNERLQRFALQVERGEVTGAAIEQRAAMYAESANPVYEDVRRAAAEDNGMDEECRILGAAEHCPDCLEESARAWQPIGTLPQIGDSACRWNCRCHFEYRMSGNAGGAGTTPDVPPGSRATYVTQTPEQAKSLADALRAAFE